MKKIENKLNNISQSKWKKFFGLIPDMEITDIYTNPSKDSKSGWSSPSELYLRFYDLFYDTGLMISFKWQEWEYGKTIPNNPIQLEKESLEHLAMLLTAIVRNDRFSEGVLLIALESKLILNIIKAMKSKIIK